MGTLPLTANFSIYNWMRKTQRDTTVFTTLISKLEVTTNLYSYGYPQPNIQLESLAASALIVSSKINLMKTNHPLQKKMLLNPIKQKRFQYSIRMIIKLYNLLNAKVILLKIISIRFCKIMIESPRFNQLL